MALRGRSDVATTTLERASSEIGPWTALEAAIYTRDGLSASLDGSAEAGHTYYYRLRVADAGGRETTWGMATAFHSGLPAGPATLFAPSPNPTPTGTTLAFRLPRPEFVRLEIVDASGRRLTTLQQGMLEPGDHQRWWDGTAEGRPVPPGLYFATLRTSEGRSAQRIAVIR